MDNQNKKNKIVKLIDMDRGGYGHQSPEMIARKLDEVIDRLNDLSEEKKEEPFTESDTTRIIDVTIQNLNEVLDEKSEEPAEENNYSAFPDDTIIYRKLSSLIEKLEGDE